MLARTALPLLALCVPLAAQERLPPEQALAAKLTSPFLAHAPWVTDFATAKEKAARRGVPIFGYFTTANH